MEPANAAPAPPSGVDPEALLVRIAALRDRAAFAELFRHYGPRVKGHLIGRGVAPAVAEDLTQDVMLSVWRKAAQFDPSRGSSAAWIFTITRNALVSHVRHARFPVVDPDDPARVEAQPADEALIGEEARRTLTAALGRLPPEQAAVIGDAYLGDRSLGQVAAERDLPLGTVKTRARLALARLRTLFGAEEE